MVRFELLWTLSLKGSEMLFSMRLTCYRSRKERMKSSAQCAIIPTYENLCG